MDAVKIREAIERFEEVGNAAEVAREIGAKKRTVQEWIQEYKQGKIKIKKRGIIRKGKFASFDTETLVGSEPHPEEVDIETDFGQEKISLFTLSPRIRTVQQAIAKAEIDLEKWEISKVRIKSWEIGTKVEGMDAKGRKFTRGIAVEPLFGVTVELKKRSGPTVSQFIDELKDLIIKSRPKKYPSPLGFSGGQLAEVSIPDIHFGKLAWGEETRENYDIDIAMNRYMTAIMDLVPRVVNAHNISRFLYVIGNDMLHVDRGTNTTTRGTPQDVDGRWQKAFQAAFKATIDAVEFMLDFAPVDLVVIPGNHDEEKAWCLGHSVESWFHTYENVTVDNSMLARKYYQFGQSMIGMQHGHFVRDKKFLPLDMARESPEMWSQTRYREIHVGHFHNEKQDNYILKSSESMQDIIVRYLPSLCGTDRYHHQNGYSAVKSAEVHVWDRSEGHIAWHSARPSNESISA